MTDRAEALGIAQRHALGALEEHEVPQRPLAKRQQGDLDVRGIPAVQDREVGPLEMRCGPNRRQDVGGQRQVQHLLLDDVDDGELPGLDARELLRRDALLDAALEGELSVQVLAEQAVLQFASLPEQVDQLLPAFDPERRLRRLPVPAPTNGHTGILAVSKAGRQLGTIPLPWGRAGWTIPLPLWGRARWGR